MKNVITVTVSGYKNNTYNLFRTTFIVCIEKEMLAKRFKENHIKILTFITHFTLLVHGPLFSSV